VEKEDGRVEVRREAVTMVLYVSIVLLATLAALPAGEGSHAAERSTGGVHGATLGALLWGTALGLALAHWFAFRLAARIFAEGRLREVDLWIGVAQVVGAGAVAALCTIPIVFFDDGSDVQATGFVPALIVGLAGYLAARVPGRSRAYSFLVGLIVLLAGLMVATAKNLLAGH
jgi:hypothetical protein